MDTLRKCISHPLYDELCELIFSGGNIVRKHLLIISRNMSLPEDTDGNMFRIVSDTIRELMNIVISRGLSDFTTANQIDTDAPEDYLNRFFSNPLYAGATIMACCISPYMSTEEEDTIRLASYMKEINVMDRRGYMPDIDFSPFFGNYQGDLHHIDIPRNPDMAKLIHQSIDRSIERISNTLQYGRYSRKPLDIRSRELLKRKCDWLAETPIEEILPVELDRQRFNKRVRMEGGCEMKQRWYTHGVSPRTYFVGGPTAFNSARYLQDFFNDLCDSTAVTNRHTRVQPWRIFIHGKKHALFYDLTSFTSNLSLQHRFLCNLSDYCRGISFKYLDLVDGLIETDLGDAIREYADQLNHFHGWYSDEFDQEGYHGPAGFLGVFGNIASATFIHGAVLLMLSEGEHECACAGDDAVIVVELDTVVFRAISRLGILAVEKTYSTESDAIFLKRRTFVKSNGHLAQRFPMILPSFVPWMNKGEYGRFRTEMSKGKREKRSLAISSLDSSFRSIAGKLSDFSDVVRAFFTKYYGLLSLKHAGNVPQYNKYLHDRDGFYPGLDFIGAFDYVEQTLEDLYPGYARVSVRGVNAYPVEVFRLRQGLRFKVYGSGTKTLTILRRLGIVEAVSDPGSHIKIYGRQGLERVLLEFERRKDFSNDSSWTTFRVVKYVPKYWPGTNCMDVEGFLESSYSE